LLLLGHEFESRTVGPSVVRLSIALHDVVTVSEWRKMRRRDVAEASACFGGSRALKGSRNVDSNIWGVACGSGSDARKWELEEDGEAGERGLLRGTFFVESLRLRLDLYVETTPSRSTCGPRSSTGPVATFTCRSREKHFPPPYHDEHTFMLFSRIILIHAIEDSKPEKQSGRSEWLSLRTTTCRNSY